MRTSHRHKNIYILSGWWLFLCRNCWERKGKVSSGRRKYKRRSPVCGISQSPPKPRLPQFKNYSSNFRQAKDFYMGPILALWPLPGCRTPATSTPSWASLPTAQPLRISLYPLQGWGQASCWHSHHLDAMVNTSFMIDPREMKLCSSCDSDPPSWPTHRHVLLPCVHTTSEYGPLSYDTVEKMGRRPVPADTDLNGHRFSPQAFQRLHVLLIYYDTVCNTYLREW